MNLLKRLHSHSTITLKKYKEISLILQALLLEISIISQIFFFINIFSLLFVKQIKF